MHSQQTFGRLKIILLIICIHTTSIKANNVCIPNIEINEILKELRAESVIIQDNYSQINDSVAKRIKKIQAKINTKSSIQTKLDLITIESRLRQQLLVNRKLEQSDLNKVRYLKGLQIMKILYEKTLSLDHHFSSVSTFHEMNKI